MQFLNPGDHSSKQEIIPASGDRAVMVMVKGDTLEEQYKNAQTLYNAYDLGAQGLSDRFVADLKDNKLQDLIAEAYGPAPFDVQTEKLVDVEWVKQDKTSARITPVKGKNASYGARAATKETVFLAQFPVFVKGSNTTPEMVESNGINIAVSSDWKTGKETTRPIVPSVAKVYYGEYFDSIPVVYISSLGEAGQINLPGVVIAATDKEAEQKSGPGSFAPPPAC